MGMFDFIGDLFDVGGSMDLFDVGGSMDPLTSALAGTVTGEDIEDVPTPEPIDYEALTEASAESAIEVLQAQTEQAQEMAQWNLAQFPEVSSVSLSQATAAGTVLDQYMEQQFYSNQDMLTPGWRQNILGAAGTANQLNTALAAYYTGAIMPGQVQSGLSLESAVSSKAQEMLTGAVPEDVAALVRQTTSESSAAQGLFGEGAQALTARDLGLTSLDMINQGASMAQLSSQLSAANQALYAGGMGIAQSPIASGTAYANLSTVFRQPMTDVSSLFSNMMGQITGSSVVSPSSVLSTGGQIYGNTLSTASDIAQANNEMQWSSTLSGIGLYNDYQNRAAATAAGQSQSQADLFSSIAMIAAMA